MLSREEIIASAGIPAAHGRQIAKIEKLFRSFSRARARARAREPPIFRD